MTLQFAILLVQISHPPFRRPHIPVPLRPKLRNRSSTCASWRSSGSQFLSRSPSRAAPPTRAGTRAFMFDFRTKPFQELLLEGIVPYYSDSKSRDASSSARRESFQARSSG
jgi:hypothetical protein